MTDSKSTVRKDRAHARVSSNDVQSTERAAVEAEERAHRAKQALKKAKKEAKKAHKAARRARKAADAAGKAFTKAAARAKKAKTRRSHGRVDDKKDRKAVGPVASDNKSASTKAAPRKADAARKNSPARKGTAMKAARVARKSDQRARQVPIAPLPEAVDESDTFVLGEPDRPMAD